MVRDIGTTALDAATRPLTFRFDLYPQPFVTFGGRALFLSDDGVHGLELWSTDASEGGLDLVVDLQPGALGIFGDAVASGSFATLGAQILFAGDDGVRGSEVWVSDGSRSGTKRLHDLAPGLYGSNPRDFSVAGSTVYFTADDREHGRELWATHSTEAGLRLVHETVPGAASLPLGPFAPSGRLLFFVVGGEDIERSGVWRTDGSDAGTLRLALPSCVGTAFACPKDLVVAPDGLVYFIGWPAGGEVTLWKSDGSEAGTVSTNVSGSPLSDLVPFMGGFILTRSNGYGQPVLWWTDGAPSGTARVPGTENLIASFRPIAAGERLFFLAWELATGIRLWMFDGEESHPLETGGPSPLARYVSENLPLGVRTDGTLLFFADDGVHGLELWRSDGSAEGTRLVQDLTVGSASSIVALATARAAENMFEDRLLFRVLRPDSGWELWSSDGSEGGTWLVGSLFSQRSGILAYPRDGTRPGFKQPLCSLAMGDHLAFDAGDGSGKRQLWRTNGTTEGATPLADFWDVNTPVPDPEIRQCGRLEDRILFSRYPGLGSVDRDALVELIYAGYLPAYFSSLGKRAYMTIGALTRILSSDGAYEGTGPVAHGDPDLAFPVQTRVVGMDALFAGHDLWKSTLELPFDAVQIRGESGPAPQFPQGMVGDPGSVLFSAWTASAGREPWISDGEEDLGTHLLVDLRPGPRDSISVELGERPEWLIVEGRFVVVADDGSHGEELWVLDPSSSSRGHLFDIWKGPESSNPRELTALGGQVLFVAESEREGRELWALDMATEAAELLADLELGPESSRPLELTQIGNRIYFSAWEASSGRELWSSDGTRSGTQRIVDLAPREHSSSPRAFVRAGGRLFFAANDNEHGFELWNLELQTLFEDDFERANEFSWSLSSP